MPWPAKKLGERKSFEEVLHSWFMDEKYHPEFIQFADSEASLINLELFIKYRSPIINAIPPQAEWYMVDFIKEDLDRTYIIPCENWRLLTGGSYHIKEALKNLDRNLEHTDQIRRIKKAGDVSKKLILIASGQESPFTVIEGNHRIVAFASKALETGKDLISREVFLGIHRFMKECIWHIESRSEYESYVANKKIRRGL